MDSHISHFDYDSFCSMEDSEAKSAENQQSAQGMYNLLH